jgi:hypothetical protein
VVFIDGKLICAMFGDDLQQVSETEIPSEPMYIIIFNQALSKDWGFPDVYFLNCDKKNAGVVWTQNAVNAPYYHAIFVRRAFLPILKFDYVRVYQVKHDDRHILGCSPPSRPTKGWIEGHNERYVLWGELTRCQTATRYSTGRSRLYHR